MSGRGRDLGKMRVRVPLRQTFECNVKLDVPSGGPEILGQSLGAGLNACRACRDLQGLAGVAFCRLLAQH